MDRHKIWRRVSQQVEAAAERAPEGYEPFVRVHIAGRPDPMVVSFAATWRSPDDVWTMLQIEAEFPADHPERVDPLPHEAAWVFAQEGAILAIDVAFRPTAEGYPPIGFSYIEKPDDQA